MLLHMVFSTESNINLHPVHKTARRSLGITAVAPRAEHHMQLRAFFCVIPRRLKFICGRLGTLCSIYAPEVQTLGNYSKESIQYIEHGESLKSRIHHHTQ